MWLVKSIMLVVLLGGLAAGTMKAVRSAQPATVPGHEFTVEVEKELGLQTARGGLSDYK